MKKFSVLLSLMLVGLMLFAGCTDSDSLNRKNTKVAKAVIQIADDYLAGEIDNDVAYDLVNKEMGKINKDGDVEASFLHMRCVSLSLEFREITGYMDLPPDDEMVLEYRNQIAKIAGLPIKES